MTIPGLGHVAPPGADWLAKRIRELEKAVAELRTARSGDYTTITGTLEVAGTENVSGTLNVGGDATFGGHMAVAGTLSLPAGIIDNDALANPVTARSFNGFDDTITLPVNPSAVSECYFGTITVPAGFTMAHVLVVADIGGTNGNAFETPIYCAAAIDGVYPDVIAQAGLAGGPATVSSFYSDELTGLSGGDTIRVSAYGATDVSGWTGGNAHVAAQVVFLR